MRGVVVHSFILLVVTALFTLPFGPPWWGGIALIGISHFLVDAVQFLYRPPIPPLLRFTIDQVLHLFFIFLALVLGGYLEWGNLWAGLVESAQATPLMTGLLGYAFITMPTWVLLKFVVYALVKGQPPNFPEGPNKYVGIVERVIITTLVLFGQVLLVPLVTLPRLIMEWPKVVDGGGDGVYLTELISSVVLAVGVGVALAAL
jgi:hypothetical protein